jgi:hypothetical protein
VVKLKPFSDRRMYFLPVFLDGVVLPGLNLMGLCTKSLQNSSFASPMTSLCVRGVSLCPLR